jgi:hypothetical protein
MPPKCRQSSLQRVERVCGVEFLGQPKPFDLHLPRATQRRWWTEREQHSEGGGGVRCHLIRGEGFVNSCIFPDMHHMEPYHGRSLLLNTYGCHQNVGNLCCRGLKEFAEFEFLIQPKPFDLHLPRATQRRWWTEREQHSEGGGRTRQVGSFEPKKNIFRTTPVLKGRRNRLCQAYKKDDDQV